MDRSVVAATRYCTAPSNQVPVTKSPATQSPTAQTPAAQPPATQSPAGNKPPDGVPGSLDEVQFQQELERLDGICAKLKLEAERKLMNGWLVSDVSDARVLFLPVTSDPLPLPASSPAPRRMPVGSSIFQRPALAMRSIGLKLPSSRRPPAMNGPLIAVCGGRLVKIPVMPKPSAPSARCYRPCKSVASRGQ